MLLSRNIAVKSGTILLQIAGQVPVFPDPESRPTKEGKTSPALLKTSMEEVKTVLTSAKLNALTLVAVMTAARTAEDFMLTEVQSLGREKGWV